MGSSHSGSWAGSQLVVGGVGFLVGLTVGIRLGAESEYFSLECFSDDLIFFIILVDFFSPDLIFFIFLAGNFSLAASSLSTASAFVFNLRTALFFFSGLNFLETCELADVGREGRSTRLRRRSRPAFMLDLDRVLWLWNESARFVADFTVLYLYCMKRRGLWVLFLGSWRELLNFDKFLYLMFPYHARYSYMYFVEERKQECQ